MQRNIQSTKSLTAKSTGRGSVSGIDVKERWEYEQPVRDVERQLAGIELKDDVEVVHGAMPPAQKALVDAVMAPPGVTLEEEIRRRNRAIRAVTDIVESRRAECTD